MRKYNPLLTLAIFIVLLAPGSAFSSDGESPCGYEMQVVPIYTGNALNSSRDALVQPEILDAWTTNDPYGDPAAEVYDFTAGQEPIAFVVKYAHTGGIIPKQYARGWICGTDRVIKTCEFNWTIGYLPPGVYMLINYFDPVQFPPGEYDWASKVGDVVFGWPDINTSRPLCFTVHN